MIGGVYLIGPEALDVARICGLQLGWLLDRDKTHRYVPRVHPNAVNSYGEDLVYLDLSRIDYWDQMRVAFARIGVHYFLKHKESPWVNSSSSASSSSSVSSSKEESANDRPQDVLGRGLLEQTPRPDESRTERRKAAKRGRGSASPVVPVEVQVRRGGQRGGDARECA